MWEPKTWVQASLQSTGAADSEGVAALSSAVEAGCSQHLPPGPVVTAGPGPAAAVRSANPSFPGTPGGLLFSVPPWEDLALSFGYSVRSSLLSRSQHRTHPGPPRVAIAPTALPGAALSHLAVHAGHLGSGSSVASVGLGQGWDLHFSMSAG